MRIRSGRRWWWRLVIPLVLVAGIGPVVPARAASAVCGADRPRSAVVRVYPRAATEEMPAGNSTLYCGDARFGLRHVIARHAADWAAVAAGDDWSAYAEGAIGRTLSGPERVRCDSVRNSCAFSRAAGPSVVLVALAREDGRVITAYPVAPRARIGAPTRTAGLLRTARPRFDCQIRGKSPLAGGPARRLKRHHALVPPATNEGAAPWALCPRP